MFINPEEAAKNEAHLKFGIKIEKEFHKMMKRLKQDAIGIAYYCHLPTGNLHQVVAFPDNSAIPLSAETKKHIMTELCEINLEYLKKPETILDKKI